MGFTVLLRQSLYATYLPYRGVLRVLSEQTDVEGEYNLEGRNIHGLLLTLLVVSSRDSCNLLNRS